MVPASVTLAVPDDPSGLADEIARMAAQLDAATHRLLGCIRRFDDSGEWDRQGLVSCAHWLSWRIGLDLGTAREKVRVARALGALPRIAELTEGQIDEDTNFPAWDGTPVDYDATLSALWECRQG